MVKSAFLDGADSTTGKGYIADKKTLQLSPGTHTTVFWGSFAEQL